MTYLRFSVLFFSFVATLTASVAVAGRPNVLLIVSDDQSAHLGCLGTPGLSTPNVDALAGEGMLFRNAFATCASCSPARSGILTGMYPHSNGHWRNTHGPSIPGTDGEYTRQSKYAQIEKVGVHEDIPTLVELLAAAGYTTGIASKFHLSPPWKYAFAHRLPATRRAESQGTAAEALFRHAGQRPFFLMVNIGNTHRPFVADAFSGVAPVNPAKIVIPPELADTLEMRQDMANYLSSVQGADKCVGAVLDALRKSGRYDNTLIIFTSDQGYAFHRAKATVYDDGIRIPFVVAGPGVCKGTSSDQLISHVDIVPTVLDYAGLPLPAKVQGMSLRPLLEGCPKVAWRKYVFAEHNSHGPNLSREYYPSRSVFDGRFHYIRNLTPQIVSAVSLEDYREQTHHNQPIPWAPQDCIPGGPWGNRSFNATLAAKEQFSPQYALLQRTFARPAEELYDLQDDPGEMRDLASAPPCEAKRGELRAALDAWMKETGDPGAGLRAVPRRTEAVSGPPPSRPPPVRPAPRQIEPFNYQGVNLEAGRFRQQFAEVSTYYLHLPNDSLLKPYRQRAGKEAPGTDMGGCYIGHNPFGQFLSGLARMYAATGDSAYKDKAVALMNGWAECIEPDGFFFAEKKPQLIPYYYEKMVCGLVDLYEYCGEKRAIEHLERITAWAEKNVSRVRRYAGSGGNDGGEWYTLSENLYRAYLLTKNDRYLAFAKVWEYSAFWNFFAQNQGTNIFTRGPAYHAYSHVNSFCGLGAGYLAGGNPDYLKTLINAYDYLQEHQCWATGGFGPKEALLPRERFTAMLSEAPNHFETQCGSWAGFKLTKYLISFTGDARFGDWTEKLLLNGIGASLPISDGKPFYYSEHNTSGSEKQLSKGNNSARWPCCSGTRSQATADLHDIIYYKDADGLYITQFIPSTVRMKVAGTDMKVTQETSFPESDTVLINIATKSATEFSIRIRNPGWLAAPMQAWVNNQAVKVEVDGKHWVVFRRKWSDGDTLKIRLPMKLWVSRINKEKAYPAAIMYGPVAMGVGLVNSNLAKKIDLTNLDTALVPAKGEPLAWKLAADPIAVVKPFYAFKEGEKYYIYLDPCPPVGASYKAARYSGGWKEFGKWTTSRAPGAWLEYRFEGRGIRIHYFKYDDGGRFRVIIDGKNVGTLDVYGPKRGVAAFAEFMTLQDGKHTLKMVLLPERSPESKGVFGNVAAFESIQKGAK